VAVLYGLAFLTGRTKLRAAASAPAAAMPEAGLPASQ